MFELFYCQFVQMMNLDASNVQLLPKRNYRFDSFLVEIVCISKEEEEEDKTSSITTDI